MVLNSDEGEPSPPDATADGPLTAAAKKYLRRVGHNLDPVVQVGKNGLTEAVLTQVEEQLDSHELIKLKFAQKCPLEPGEAVPELIAKTEAKLVQQIGRVVMLFRPAREPEKRKIKLPKPPKPRAPSNVEKA